MVAGIFRRNRRSDVEVRRPLAAARRPPAEPRRSLLDTIPAWLSAIAAFGGLVLVVVGYNAVTKQPPVPREPDAHVRLITYDETGFTAVGEYAAIRTGHDEVVLLGRPAAAKVGSWAHVEAALVPVVKDTETGTEDGDFEATMPIGYLGEPWSVQVLVVRGGMNGLDEPSLGLTDMGADCTCVIFAGEPQLVGEAP